MVNLREALFTPDLDEYIDGESLYSPAIINKQGNVRAQTYATYCRDQLNKITLYTNMAIYNIANPHMDQFDLAEVGGFEDEEGEVAGDDLVTSLANSMLTTNKIYYIQSVKLKRNTNREEYINRIDQTMNAIQDKYFPDFDKFNIIPGTVDEEHDEEHRRQAFLVEADYRWATNHFTYAYFTALLRGVSEHSVHKNGVVGVEYITRINDWSHIIGCHDNQEKGATLMGLWMKQLNQLSFTQAAFGTDDTQRVFICPPNQNVYLRPYIIGSCGIAFVMSYFKALEGGIQNPILIIQNPEEVFPYYISSLKAAWEEYKNA